MLKILTERKWPRTDYTVGIMYINGERFCETLEDKDRGLTTAMSLSEIKKKKVYMQTAIPKGKYIVTMDYSPKFGRKLPHVMYLDSNGKLVEVPGFTGIRIHSGNTAKDTAGCILVGRNTKVGMLTDSRNYSDKLNAIIQQYINAGEKVVLEVR